MDAGQRRVVVTRPALEGVQWVTRFQARGITALALPLIEISPAPDAAALVQVWQRITEFDALMFVSSNAITQFFAACPPALTKVWASATSGPRLWVTGPGSRAALLACGVAGTRIDMPAPDAPSLDSEALWLQVQAQVRTGLRVLIVRGDEVPLKHEAGLSVARTIAPDSLGASAKLGEQPPGQGRNWLAQQLKAQGVGVEFVVAYLRAAPQWTAAQRTLVQQALGNGDIWLWSSGQALGNLLAAFPGQSWANARAIATHARIAKAAREAGFGTVVLSAPGFDALCASIESLA